MVYHPNLNEKGVAMTSGTIDTYSVCFVDNVEKGTTIANDRNRGGGGGVTHKHRR